MIVYHLSERKKYLSKIGEWVRARRRENALGKLSQDRMEMLQSIPGWTWENSESSLSNAREEKNRLDNERSEFSLKALKAYVKRYKHLPRTSEAVWNLMLNKWVDNRKQDLKRGSPLSLELTNLLKAQSPKPFPKQSREEFEIAIPTFRREHTIQKMTLEMIRYNRISPESVTLFVANEGQAKSYTKSLKDEYKIFSGKIIVAEPGIRAARNAIRNHYDPGTHVVSIDDDVRNILVFRRKFMKASLRDIIRDGLLMCDSTGAKLWGVYPVKNSQFMGTRPMSGLAFIQGQFFGCIVDRDPTMNLELEIKEDHENTLKHYTRDGLVARLEYAVADSIMYETPGGIQSTTLRTMQKNRKAAESLYRKYSDIITLFVRKSTGLTEIRYISR